MAPPDPARRRRVAVVAGLLSILALAGALLVWLSSDAAAGRAPFGSTGSIAVVIVGLFVTLAGTLLVVREPQLPPVARWSAALVVTIVNGIIGVLALVAVFGADDGTDLGVGLLLGIALFGTNIVAGQITRTGRTHQA